MNRKVWLYSLLMSCLILGCEQGETSRTYTIGFSQCTSGDAWRQAMHRAMDREMFFHPSLQLIRKDANGNSELQQAHIREFMEATVDLLIVSPNEAEPITPLVDQAFEQRIPVIILDRKTNSPFYSAYVGADNYDIGRTAGKYAANILAGGGRVLEIWGLPGSSPAIDRHEGFMEGIKNHVEISVVAKVNGDWERPLVRQRLPEILAQHADIDLIFAHNDRMAQEAYKVCDELGRAQGIKFIGIDGLPGTGGGIQLVGDGILNATVLYPTGGEEVIRIAASILEGRPFEKENILHTTVIDSSNVRVINMQTSKILSQQEDIERQQAKIDQQIHIYRNQRIISFVLLIGLLVAVALSLLTRKALKERKVANLQLAQQNDEILEQQNQLMEMAEKARQATQERLQFFTNISHEFRTPLTLILGPIEELIRSRNITPYQKKDLSLVQKNALRLLRLVNQLMDFRKLESGNLSLHASQQNLKEFLGEILAAFEKVAQQRHIDLRLMYEPADLEVWFDPNMLDKVLFNLLSNAFKFTGDHGLIHVIVQENETENQVKIYVKDSGIGMSETQLQHAFDRFYQGDAHPLGTGLGLSLSLELVKLHGGQLTAASEPQQGTTFLIKLPLGNAHFEPHQIDPTQPQIFHLEGPLVLIDEGGDPQNALPPQEPISPHEDSPSLLLIEDHIELRTFLKEKLQQMHFTVYEAGTGEAGLELAHEKIPDTIICDVMLPGKNGFAITEALKSDLRTSHIPVILLTAQTAIENQLKGIQTGADVYLTKPFQPEYLIQQIKNLIKNREILKARYLMEVSPDSSHTIPQKLDRKFINDFISVIEQHYSNPDLNVNDIGKEMGLSRVQLYRKVKALMDCTVSDYLKQARLNKAAHLLKHTDKPISAIAYEVGFASPPYFSTAFKNQYGCSPTEYKGNYVNQSP